MKRPVQTKLHSETGSVPVFGLKSKTYSTQPDRLRYFQPDGQLLPDGKIPLSEWSWIWHTFNTFLQIFFYLYSATVRSKSVSRKSL